MKLIVFVIALFSWIQLTQGRCTKVCLFHVSRLFLGVQSIDSNISSLCSHVIIGYGIIVDPENPRIQLYERVNQYLVGLQALKKVNANFKILLQVQNWRSWDDFNDAYDKMISSMNGRRTFVQKIVKFLREMGFDGIQIRERHFKRLVTIRKDHIVFLQELAEAFRLESSTTGRPKLLLFESLPESTNIPLLDTCSDVMGICRIVDMVTLETFFFFPLRNVSYRHHSRLFGESPLDQHSVNFVTNYVLSKGCAKEKLLIAILPAPHTFKHNPRIYPEGLYLSAGVRSYDAFCGILKQHATKIQHLSDQAPYLCTEDWSEGRLIEKCIHYFEDALSLKAKANYINQKGLGGFIMWEFIMDDIWGDCNEGLYPLLRILSQECK
ncbi:chitinase-3-like protein 1 [Biomphalaria pfeifferi]|uniref:Chitinase-3-like protein 1 n=1 Tax=Biomphalaria pfeifferi TaxID=112525 RepID=A0AAD8F930_BIOPF|nr:chitinase-3-like protein 1 [Biomphalaria pfeifferi]